MIDDYKFGQIYEGKISEEDIDYYSNLFGEGSESLTELIKYCMENDIKTFASCKGHPDERNVLEAKFENGYLAFRILKDDEFAYFLASLPYAIPNIKAYIDFDLYTCKKCVSIEVPATKVGMSDTYFAALLEELKKYKELINSGGKIQYNEDVVKIVDYVFSYPSNTSFYVTSKGFIRKDAENYYKAHISRCSNKKINKVHEWFCNTFNKPKNVDDLLSSGVKRF